MGSGTTGIAALMNNRKYIGIDISTRILRPRQEKELKISLPNQHKIPIKNYTFTIKKYGF